MALKHNEPAGFPTEESGEIVLENFVTDRSPEGRTSIALGIFDGMHKAHREVIAAAVAGKSEGLEPWVFTFAMDECPSAKAEAHFLMSEDMKFRLMRHCGVKHVAAPKFAELRELSAEQFLDEVLCGRLHAGKLACGYDFRCGKGASCGVERFRELCTERGVELTVVGEQDDGGEAISSSRIRAAVAAGDMKTAERLAGYPFVIDYPVCEGAHLGRRHGLPTINQTIPAGFVMPRFGVYTSTVCLEDGTFLPAVTNVGVKPTVAENAAPAAETHIIEFTGGLYGKRVPVFLLEFLREERRFDSEAELFAQIGQDSKTAKAAASAWIKSAGEPLKELFCSTESFG